MTPPRGATASGATPNAEPRTPSARTVGLLAEPRERPAGLLTEQRERAARLVAGPRERKRKTIRNDSDNAPYLLPVCTPGVGTGGDAQGPTKKRRGKARTATCAPTVGAAQRLAENMCKVNEASARAATEGTVQGQLGAKHYLFTATVLCIGGRVDHNSKGGPRTKCELEAAAARAPEVFVMAHDAGSGQGKTVSNRRFARLLQHAASKLLEHTSASPQHDTPSSTPLPRITVLPRVRGQAQLTAVDFVRDVRPHSGDSDVPLWAAARSVDNDTIMREVAQAHASRVARSESV